MLRPRRNNEPTPKGPQNQPRPSTAPRGTVVLFKCGHGKKAEHFRGENCPDCRGKRRQKKRDENGSRKSATIAASAFRFPFPVRFIKDFGGVNWSGELLKYDPKTGWDVLLASIRPDEAAKMGLTNSFKLEQALTEMYKQKCPASAARRQTPGES